MIKQHSKPILITGSHRSGTTWFASMLALSEETLLVGEPFNVCSWAYKLDGLAKYWYTYAPELNSEAAQKAIQKVLDGKTYKVFSRRQVQRYLPFTRSGRVIIKDPIACFSSEWLYQNFDCCVAVIVRHPAAFALSLKRMNWTLSPVDILSQPKMMRELLWPYELEIKNWPEDIIEQSALIWKLVYSTLRDFSIKYPEWMIFRHEDLSLNPVSELFNVYKQLDLSWNNSVEAKIIKFTGSNNPTTPKSGVPNQIKRNSTENVKRWQKVLTKKEIEKIYEITSPVSCLFYDDKDWFE